MNTILYLAQYTSSIFGRSYALYTVTMMMAIVFLPFIICLIARWKIFTKAGRPGWAALIPIYRTYVMFDIVYGDGWKMLLLIIPLVNLFVALKFLLDLSIVYEKGTAFAIGLLFFEPIFICILGFDNGRYIGPVANHSANKGSNGLMIFLGIIIVLILVNYCFKLGARSSYNEYKQNIMNQTYQQKNTKR